MSIKHRILHANPNLATGPVIMISNAAAPEFREARHVVFNRFTEGHEIKRLETAPARPSPSAPTKTPLRYHGTGARYARRASEPGSPGLDSATIDRLLGRKNMTVDNEFTTRGRTQVKNNQGNSGQNGGQNLVHSQTTRSVENGRTREIPPPLRPLHSSHGLSSNGVRPPSSPPMKTQPVVRNEQPPQKTQYPRNRYHQNPQQSQNPQPPSPPQYQPYPSDFDHLEDPPQSPTHSKQKPHLSLDTIVNTPPSNNTPNYPKSPRVSCHSFQSLIVPSTHSITRPVSVETHSPLATVLNPKHFLYEPRGDMRVQRLSVHRTVMECFMVSDSPRLERAIELLMDDYELMKEMWMKADEMVGRMEIEGENLDGLEIWRGNRERFEKWGVIYQELIEDAQFQMEEERQAGIGMEKRVDPIASPLSAVIEKIPKETFEEMEAEAPPGMF
ncbi:hypothetical protein BZA77DRAFT_369155 [Pyronema omphalodes]|nr:hypothetical protein BZA77DRAFT_369155 [Pyronema omphalodes]